MGEFLAQASRSGKELLATTTYDALLKGSTRPGRAIQTFWNRDPKRVLVAIVRDLDVVPDDPDQIDLAVALLPPSIGLGSMWLGMYYPLDWPANDASATGRKIHDVTMKRLGWFWAALRAARFSLSVPDTEIG